MEQQIPKIGVNVFVIDGDKVLLGKRAGKRGTDSWCLPGGHLEYGESMVEAAKRELQEETGLAAESLEFVHLINDPRDDSHYVHVNFRAEKWSGTPSLTEPDKFSAWEWFPLDALPEPIFVGHRHVVPILHMKQTFFDSVK
jgi:8-oxo-dGTP diphosphatase